MSHTHTQQSVCKNDFIQPQLLDLVSVMERYTEEEIFAVLGPDFEGLVVDLDGNLTIPPTPYHHAEYLAVWILAYTVPTLTSLNLTRSHLTALPLNFSSFTALKHLNLSHNRFATLPDVVSTLPSLTHLQLMGNLFRLTADTFPNPIHLDVRGLDIQSIPETTVDMTIYGDQLKTLLPLLEHSHVRILTIEDYEDFDSSIVLNQLQELTVHSSLVKNLPAFLTRCPNLESLTWEYGHILSWPDNLYFPKLQTLSLRHNRIAWLSGNIKKHALLTSIDLSHNSLRVVPQSIRNCTHITSLNLSHNQLSKFEIDSGLMSDLTHLDLSHNPLHHLSAHISGQKLVSLNISHTKMEATPSLTSYVYGIDCTHDEPCLLTPIITENEQLIRSLQISSLLRFLSAQTMMEELDLSHQRFNSLEDISVILEKAQPQTLWFWKTSFPNKLPETTPRPKIVYAESSVLGQLPDSWQDIIITPKLFSVAISSPFSRKAFRSLLLEIHPQIFSHSYDIPKIISLPFGLEAHYCEMFAQRDIILTEVEASY